MLKELIPYFAMTVVFVIPGLIGLIAIVMWFKSRARLYQSIDNAVERGASQEVIDKLVEMTKSKEEKEEKKGVVKHLSEGVPMLAVGIAFIVYFYIGGLTGVIFPGVLLTLFGLGKLGIALYVAKSSKPEGE